ncbi:MAG: hypothetical protein ACI39H_04355 [Lachnospiraceae bacterium]
MKIKNGFKSYSILFLVGILAGIICRLSDFFPYESLWSLSSIATMFGFWIASVSVITYCSSSNRGAFLNSFLYMFGMTISFYGLKYILGFFSERFSGEFPTMLFIAYSVMSVVCGIGSGILYFWNKDNLLGSVLCALPASGMLAEAIGCLIVLLKRQMLLGQTLFDFLFALIFGVLLFRKASSKVAYFVTLAIITGAVFCVIYLPSCIGGY